MIPNTSNPGARRAIRLLAALAFLAVVAALVPPAVQGKEARAASSATSAASLSLKRIISTNPVKGSNLSLDDQEGSTYVPRDGSLWMADDDGRRLVEVDAASGALKRSIGPRTLESARAVRGPQRAGVSRTQDLESLAYDRVRDVLYAFSGSCCTSEVRPAVFRLVRKRGRLRVESFRPLQEGSDNTASAWHRPTRTVFVGNSDTIRRYSYRTNRYGRKKIQVPGLKGIFGMEFEGTGKVLHVVHTGTRLSRVRWRSKSLVRTYGLAEHGIGDARAVAKAGRRLFVSDGHDGRRDDDRRRLAVYVFTYR